MLKLLVDVLGAADKPDACQAVAPPIESLLGGGDDPRIVGQAQIVVRTQVQDLGVLLHPDAGPLRGHDDALGLKQAIRAYTVKLRPDLRLTVVNTSGRPLAIVVYRLAQVRTTLPHKALRTVAKAASKSRASNLCVITGVMSTPD